MRAAMSIEFAKLVQCVEKSLVMLGYHYLRNNAERIAKFEIVSLCHFRVLIEEQTSEKSLFAMLKFREKDSTRG
jgi:hypothetical protein